MPPASMLQQQQQQQQQEGVMHPGDISVLTGAGASIGGGRDDHYDHETPVGCLVGKELQLQQQQRPSHTSTTEASTVDFVGGHSDDDLADEDLTTLGDDFSKYAYSLQPPESVDGRLVGGPSLLGGHPQPSASVVSGMSGVSGASRSHNNKREKKKHKKKKCKMRIDPSLLPDAIQIHSDHTPGTGNQQEDLTITEYTDYSYDVILMKDGEAKHIKPNVTAFVAASPTTGTTPDPGPGPSIRVAKIGTLTVGTIAEDKVVLTPTPTPAQEEEEEGKKEEGIEMQMKEMIVPQPSETAHLHLLTNSQESVQVATHQIPKNNNNNLKKKKKQQQEQKKFSTLGALMKRLWCQGKKAKENGTGNDDAWA